MAAKPEDIKSLAKAMEDFLDKGGKVKVVLNAMQDSTKNFAKGIAMADGEMGKILDKMAKGGGLYDELAYKTKSMVYAEQDVAKTLAVKARMLQANIKLEEAEAQIAREAYIRDLASSELNEGEQALLLQRYTQLQTNLEIIKKEKEQAAKILEIEDSRFKMLDGINSKMSTLKDIITDGRVAAAIFFGQMNKGYKDISHNIKHVRDEGHTLSQSFKKVGTAMLDAFSFSGASAKDSLEVMEGMRSELGSLNNVTREARLEAASLAKTYGIGNAQAGALTATFATMPGATMESANNMLEFTGNLSKAAGVAPGEVMKSIAESSEDVAAYTKDGGENIAVAAVAAKKLGVTFGTITKAAEGLLDFENSINKQMEASVLLGREINLDKAREAALNGDLVGATKEMLKNVGGEAEFNRMNVMQRKALAESMGLSVTDLSKMVKHQDELNNLTQEQQEAWASGEHSMDETLANASGFASKLWESTKSVVSLIAGFGELSKGVKETWSVSKDLFGGIVAGVKGFKGGGGIKGAIKGVMGGGADLAKDSEVPEKGAKDLASTAVDKSADIAAKAQEIKPGGGGIAATFKDVAEGLKYFADGKVLLGAFSAIVVGVGLAAMTLGVPAILLLSTEGLGVNFASNAEGIAKGIKALGNLAVLKAVLIASVIIALLGAALIPLGYALGTAAPFIEAFGKVITAVFDGMATVVKAIADAFVVMFQAFADNWQILIPVGIGLAALGVGMLTLGAASWFAFPGLMLAAAGLALMIPGLTMVNAIAQENALGSLADSLIGIGMAGPGLALVGASLMGISIGLGAMALAGLAAIPIIGALTMLAAVAPALAGLMGGGGKDEDDGMAMIAMKLDQLIAVASRSGEVKMDGKKVGEVIRLGLNMSNVR